MGNEPSKHTLYFNLLDAFKDPDHGCPICVLVTRRVSNYLDGLSYENVNDPGIRTTLREAHGFCNHHAWQFVEEQRDSLGVGIIYRDILRHLQEEMQHVAPDGHTSPFGHLLAGLLNGGAAGDHAMPDTSAGEPPVAPPAVLRPHGMCPACELVARSEDDYLTTFLDHYRDTEFREAYRKSAGLCLLHLRLALACTANPTTFQHLLDDQRSFYHQLEEDLNELIRKKDYRFASEERGREQSAWIRAVEQVIGKPGIR